MTRIDSKSPPPKLSAEGLRFGIVASEFNSSITNNLLSGALRALKSSGASDTQIETVRVPGSFEIPLAAKKLAQTGRVDSIIAIGCVIRGETSHYDYICSEVSRGVQLAQMDTGVPIIFCVLTCDTLTQAEARSGGAKGADENNKGYEAGFAAIEMATLAKRLSAKAKPVAPKPRRHPKSATPKRKPRKRHSR